MDVFESSEISLSIYNQNEAENYNCIEFSCSTSSLKLQDNMNQFSRLQAQSEKILSIEQMFNNKILKSESQVNNQKISKFNGFQRPKLQISNLKQEIGQLLKNKEKLLHNQKGFDNNQDKLSELETQQNNFSLKYQKLECIGQGGNGVCYKARNLEDSTIYVAKFIIANNEELKNIVEKEYNILKSLSNPYIIKPHEIIYLKEKETIIIIQEYFKSKTLYEILKQKQRKLETSEISRIIESLLNAIKYLHENNIIHRDITLLNVLYQEETASIKLIDFGISKRFQCNSKEFTISPTFNKIFGPPEVFSTNKLMYDEKVDEYGAGLILLSLLENKIITTKKVQKVLNQSQQQEKSLYNLAQNLLMFDGQKRCSANEAIKQLKISN